MDIFKAYEILIETYAAFSAAVDALLPNEKYRDDLSHDIFNIQQNDVSSTQDSFIVWMDYLITRGIIWVPMDSMSDLIKGLYVHVCHAYDWIIHHERHYCPDDLRDLVDDATVYWFDLEPNDPQKEYFIHKLDDCFNHDKHHIHITLNRGLFDWDLDVPDVNLRIMDVADVLPTNLFTCKYIENINVGDIEKYYGGWKWL